MKPKDRATTWMDAKSFFVGIYAVPGSFGVNAMATLSQYMLNVPLPRDTAVIVYTASKVMLLVLYVAPDGRREMLKIYAPAGHKFIPPEPAAPDVSVIQLSRAQVQRLPTQIESTRPTLPAKRKARK